LDNWTSALNQYSGFKIETVDSDIAIVFNRTLPALQKQFDEILLCINKPREKKDTKEKKETTKKEEKKPNEKKPNEKIGPNEKKTTTPKARKTTTKKAP
jgi:hypothetical protein